MSDWEQAGQVPWLSNSGEPIVEVGPTPELQLTEEQKSELIREWLGAKERANVQTEQEKEHRSKVTAALFPTPKKGTQRYISPQGYGAIKLVHGWNYTLGDKDKIGTDGLKVTIAIQVEAMLDKISALGERGEYIAERIVKWRPELVAAEYELLAASNNEDDVKAKAFIDELLTVSPASPQLTFEPPKAPK